MRSYYPENTKGGGKKGLSLSCFCLSNLIMHTEWLIPSSLLALCPPHPHSRELSETLDPCGLLVHANSMCSRIDRTFWWLCGGDRQFVFLSCIITRPSTPRDGGWMRKMEEEEDKGGVVVPLFFVFVIIPRWMDGSLYITPSKSIFFSSSSLLPNLISIKVIFVLASFFFCGTDRWGEKKSSGTLLRSLSCVCYLFIFCKSDYTRTRARMGWRSSAYVLSLYTNRSSRTHTHTHTEMREILCRRTHTHNTGPTRPDRLIVVGGKRKKNDDDDEHYRRKEEREGGAWKHISRGVKTCVCVYK